MKKNNTGFTLVEMIVTVTVIIMILPVLFNITYITLQQQTKIYRLSQVKREGDYVLNVISNLIKNNANGIYDSNDPATRVSLCDDEDEQSPPGTALFFKDKQDNVFQLELTNILGSQYAIASNSYIPANNLADNPTLTTTNVNINNTTFSISCLRKNLFSPPTVSINFDIEYYPVSSRAEETASMNYQTQIKLKNY